MYSPKRMNPILRLYSFFSQSSSRLKNWLYNRRLLLAHRAPVFVISVGNISLGGTGKTPLAVELLIWLAGRGRRPALVSRGYRGRWEQTGGTLSDGQRILGTWRDSGDEPFMVARAVPRAGVFIGKDRLASCRKARELGFDTVVLDDGFQYRRLGRDFDIVLFSPTEKGALREPPSSLKRADAILVRKEEFAGGGEDTLPAGSPAAIAYSTVSHGLHSLENGDSVSVESFAGRRILAFCGIARPERFLEQLKKEGLEIVSFLRFPDHHAYPQASIEKLRKAAQAASAEAAVTTAKDGVKLADLPALLGRIPVYDLRIGLKIEPGLFDQLEAALVKHSAA
jgi:tetraacyldisaccharide 4'-kinase